MLKRFQRWHVSVAITSLAFAMSLALCPPASALVPGELFAVSGLPGVNAFLPGLANTSSLDKGDTVTSFFQSDNTRKLSDDGRYLVFASQADGLSAADNNIYINIFVQDRLTGIVTLVNVPAPGGSNEGDSTEPVISGDGSEVAFTSRARLSPQDTDEQSDVYLRNLATGTTKLISVRSDGAQGVGLNLEPDLSHDGSTVGFTSTVANTFSSNDTDPDEDVYTANVSSGALTLISQSSTGEDAAGNAAGAAVDFNGGAVAFETEANNIDEASNPDTDTLSDVYLRTGATTTLISRASGEGAKGDKQSSDPAISGDGQLVAFTSIATNLAPPKPGFQQAVYLRDTSEGGTTVQISRQSGSEGGATGNGASISATISEAGGGTKVAFASTSTNFAGGLTGERLRAFVRSIGGGTTTLISRTDGASGAPVQAMGAPSIATASAEALPPVAFASIDSTLSNETDPDFGNVYVREGTTTSWRSRPPAGTPWQGGAGFSGLGSAPGRVISRDGRFVAFVSFANAYRPPGTPLGDLVLVRDLSTGAITIASRADGAGGAAVVGRNPAISGGGTKVAFESEAEVVAGVPGGTDQVYVRDLSTGRTQLASELEGAAGNASSSNPALSTDGRWVAFESTATNLGAPAGQVYVHDLQSGQTLLVSRASGTAGLVANKSAESPSIDADGTHVTFETTATNLDPADKDAFQSIYERNLASATTTLVSQGPGGVPNNEGAFNGVLSGDGSRVAFASNATNLDPADTTPNQDVFLRDLSAGTTTLVSQPDAPTFNVQSFDLSEDGSTVSWITDAPVLPEDTDKTSDLYARDLASATTSLIGRTAAGAPLQDGVARGALDGDAGCVAMQSGARAKKAKGRCSRPGCPARFPRPTSRR